MLRFLSTSTIYCFNSLCEKMNNPVEAAAAYTEYIYLNPDGVSTVTSLFLNCQYN